MPTVDLGPCDCCGGGPTGDCRDTYGWHAFAANLCQDAAPTAADAGGTTAGDQEAYMAGLFANVTGPNPMVWLTSGGTPFCLWFAQYDDPSPPPGVYSGTNRVTAIVNSGTCLDPSPPAYPVVYLQLGMDFQLGGLFEWSSIACYACPLSSFSPTTGGLFTLINVYHSAGAATPAGGSTPPINWPAFVTVTAC